MKRWDIWQAAQLVQQTLGILEAVAVLPRRYDGKMSVGGSPRGADLVVQAGVEAATEMLERLAELGFVPSVIPNNAGGGCVEADVVDSVPANRGDVDPVASILDCDVNEGLYPVDLSRRDGVLTDAVDVEVNGIAGVKTHLDDASTLVVPAPGQAVAA